MLPTLLRDGALSRTAAAVVAVPRDRLRAELRNATTPGRLRRVGATIVLGALVTAVVSVLSGAARTEAVHQVGTRIAALSADAAQLYQSLADADAMATSGFVSGGREPPEVRARYDDDIENAAGPLVHAAGQLPEGDPSAGQVATIATQLPVYTGLIEAARTYNNQGLPLGQSYLNNGSQLMRSTILPAAEELRRTQTAALADAYRRGGAFPFAVLLLGAAVLAGVVDVAVLERRRTNRVLSPGLLVAGVAMTGVVLWWAVVVVATGEPLGGAHRHSDAATALDDARAALSQARSNESLVLAARSGGTAKDEDFTTQLERVLGTDGDGGLLAQASGRDADVEAVRVAALAWQEAHRRVRELDGRGEYRKAVESVTGTAADGSGPTFRRLDTALADAVNVERAAFTDDVARAGAAQTMLTAGPAVLALLAAAAVVVGIGRRVGEYR